MLTRLGSVCAQFHRPRVDPRCVAKGSRFRGQRAACRACSGVLQTTSCARRESDLAQICHRRHAEVTFSSAAWCSLTTSWIRLPAAVLGPSVLMWCCSVLERSWISPLGRRAIRRACKAVRERASLPLCSTRRRPKPRPHRGSIRAQWRSPSAAYACFNARDVCET
jgi:hypothetical protein